MAEEFYLNYRKIDDKTPTCYLGLKNKEGLKVGFIMGHHMMYEDNIGNIYKMYGNGESSLLPNNKFNQKNIVKNDKSKKN